VNGVQAAGDYAVPFGPGVGTASGRGGSLPSGVYFARLVAGRFVATRKMLMMR
jgi:hypothetical protein